MGERIGRIGRIHTDFFLSFRRKLLRLFAYPICHSVGNWDTKRDAKVPYRMTKQKQFRIVDFGLWIERQSEIHNPQSEIALI
jgi:hypothetical protein